MERKPLALESYFNAEPERVQSKYAFKTKINSGPTFASFKEYTNKLSRFACYCGFSAAPTVPFFIGFPLFLVTFIVGVFLLYIDKSGQRKYIVAIWLGGMLASILFSSLFTNRLVLSGLFLIFAIIASGLLDEMERKKGPE